MKRVAAIGFLLALFTHAAVAQPTGPAPKPAVKTPAKQRPARKPAPKPADPYAEAAPDDPYATPVKPAAKPNPKKPGKPDDPYADAAPAEPVPERGPGDPFPPAIPAVPVAPKPAKIDPKAPKKPVKPIDPYAAPDLKNAPLAIPARVSITDATAVQGLLAVQRLDGWLLFDRDGENPIARRLVAPTGTPSRPWFYLIPARGPAVALVHDAEKRSFEHLPGTKLTYLGHKDLDKQLRTLLKGMRTVALEYSAKAAVPSVSHVDAGTLELVRATGVQVRSSEMLVQYTKAMWGDAGRTAHYVAAHHIVELRKDALAYVAKQVGAGVAVNEYEVQQRIVRGMTMRGLVGAPPLVAAGVHTADPAYLPTAASNAPIRRGDLLVISLAAKLDKPDGIYAAQTWCAVVDKTVSDELEQAFETASLARDHALSLITDRARKNRPITGADVDQATRAFIKKAGFADKVLHRTGHSIDTDLQGGGADLDDFEVHDTRILTAGTGVTIGPGLYLAGRFGVRTEVSVYLSPNGPEITTPAQDDIETLLH